MLHELMSLEIAQITSVRLSVVSVSPRSRGLLVRAVFSPPPGGGGTLSCGERDTLASEKRVLFSEFRVWLLFLFSESKRTDA
jgi:hypothetical protein